MILAIILTTLTDTTAQDARGMTLSSVTSLSIHPEPLVQFNMQIPSRTSEALHSRNLFALNFLTPTNGSIQKLRRFSQAINPKLRQSQVKIDEQDHDLYHDPFLSTNDFIYANGNFIKEESISDTNTEINWEKALSMEIPSSGSWIPTIANAAHVIYCDIYKTFTVNDHEIWVAKILAIEKRNEAKGGVLFHNHGFHGIGEKIDDLWPKSKAKIGSR